MTVAEHGRQPGIALASGDWNPRYIAYALHQKRTPNEQRRHDRETHPNAPALPFLSWMSERRQAFAKTHPEALAAGMIVDHDAFTAWLEASA